MRKVIAEIAEKKRTNQPITPEIKPAKSDLPETVLSRERNY
jgi:hypothetical protein